MIIKCPNCGHDNQLGAIFCRNCGKKLDIEQFRPAVKDMKYKAGVGEIIQKVLGIVTVLMIVALLAAAFIPFGLTSYEQPSAELAKAAKDKLDAVSASLVGSGTKKHSFSPAEFSAAYNAELLATASDAGVDRVRFDLLPSGDAAVIRMDSKLVGFLPIHLELFGKPTSTGANFDVSSAKIGYLPIPIPFLRDLVASKAAGLTHGDSQKFVSAIRGVEMVDGNFVLSVEAAPKNPAAK